MKIRKHGKFIHRSRRQLAASGLAAVLAATGALPAGAQDQSSFWDVTYSMLEAGIAPSEPAADTSTDGCFAEIDPQVRKSTVFLLAFYETVRLQGSGVIVSESQQSGYNGVLTAGHVVKRELMVAGEIEELREVLAFDAEGTYLGAMMPSLVLDPGTGDDIDAAPIEWAMNDIAVLRMEQFASEAAAAGWNERGLPLSPVQSTFLQIAKSTPGSTAFNPGVSGGPILNENNEIIGLATHVHHLDNGYASTSSSTYLEAMERSIDDATEWLLFEIEDQGDTMKSEGAPQMNTGGLLVGTPVSHAPILGALGAGPITASEVGETSGSLAGYPGWDCKATPITVMEMTGYQLPARTAMNRAWENTVSLMDAYADEIIIGEIQILEEGEDLIFTETDAALPTEDFAPG